MKWVLHLNEFDSDIKYAEGRTNHVVEDALSIQQIQTTYLFNRVEIRVIDMQVLQETFKKTLRDYK